MVESQNHPIVQTQEVISVPTESERDAMEAVERLKGLASRLREFLLTQIDRLERDDRHKMDTTEKSLLARQMEEFRQERESWELQRQQEVAQLRGEGLLLKEAWQRLETEERRLLAERELLRRGAIAGQQSMRSSNAPLSASVEDDYSAGAVRTGKVDQEHLAWLQFQQLRREIQRHGSRTK